MLILHASVVCDLKRSPIYFGVKRSKVKVRFHVRAMHCFRTITITVDTSHMCFPSPKEVRYWYGFKRPKVNARLWNFEFVVMSGICPFRTSLGKYMQFLCRLWSIAAHRDHFVQCLSIRKSHFLVTMFCRWHVHSLEFCHSDIRFYPIFVYFFRAHMLFSMIQKRRRSATSAKWRRSLKYQLCR